jgi:Fe2+ or Zn2+ uptake regulation protein
MLGKKENIEKMILAYLEQNPDAADTIEGITKFWMQRENADITIAKVSRTLARLVRKGRIKAFQSLDGTLFFKLKKDLSWKMKIFRG